MNIYIYLKIILCHMPLFPTTPQFKGQQDFTPTHIIILANSHITEVLYP